MTYMEAWAWIIREWGCVSWKGIRPDVAKVLNLEGVGMCHHMIVSQVGAKGINDSIRYLNRERGKNY